MVPRTRQEGGGERRSRGGGGGGGETDWLCGMAVDLVVMHPNSAEFRIRGSGGAAAVRCAPRARLETSQPPVVGLVGHAALSCRDKTPPSSPELTVHVGSGDYCISNTPPPSPSPSLPPSLIF